MKTLKTLLMVITLIAVGMSGYFYFNQNTFLFDKLILGWEEVWICLIIFAVSDFILYFINYAEKKKLSKECLRYIQEKIKVENTYSLINTKLSESKEDFLKVVNELGKIKRERDGFISANTKLEKELEDEKKCNSEKSTRILELQTINKEQFELLQSELKLKLAFESEIKELKSQIEKRIFDITHIKSTPSKIKNNKQSLKKVKEVKKRIR